MERRKERGLTGSQIVELLGAGKCEHAPNNDLLLDIPPLGPLFPPWSMHPQPPAGHFAKTCTKLPLLASLYSIGVV